MRARMRAHGIRARASDNLSVQMFKSCFPFFFSANQNRHGKPYRGIDSMYIIPASVSVRQEIGIGRTQDEKTGDSGFCDRHQRQHHRANRPGLAGQSGLQGIGAGLDARKPQAEPGHLGH